MFDYPGGKLRVLALVCFTVQIIAAVVLFFVGIFLVFDGEEGSGLYLLGALLSCVMAWVSAIPMMALSEAAEDAETAAFNSKKALEILENYVAAKKEENKN